VFQAGEPFHGLSPDAESETRILPVRRNLSVFSFAKGGNLQGKAPFRGFLGDFTSKNVIRAVLFSSIESGEVCVLAWKNALSDTLNIIHEKSTLKLNECSSNGSIWVGDPKQAIYAFRGTDPELMKAVASKITNQQPLKYSWRSREKLVNLANVLFTHAFSSTLDSADVTLRIPDKRKEKAVGGIIEAWHLNGENSDERMKSLAVGIAELIRDKGVVPNNICVLFRSNTECEKLTKALAEWNIPASASSGALLETVECQLVDGQTS